MKIKLSQFIVLALCGGNCYANDTPAYRQEFDDAKHNGAKTKIAVCVADDHGIPVSNATVSAVLNPSWNARKYTTISEETETNGIAELEGTTIFPYIGGVVNKNGYYQSGYKLRFGETSLHDNGGESSKAYYASKVKDGRWLPWNPTILVVLKKVRNPVRMILSYEHVRIPRMDEPLGFDLEKHDWVAPDGTGQRADMIVRFELISESSPFRKLAVEFPGDMNGAYVCKKDGYSILKSDYHAMTNMAYEARIDNGEGKRGPAHILLGGDDYLVFRIRSKVDEDGNLISALYGKIYGPFDYFVASKSSMRLITFLNPVENDTNLEFDGKGFGDGTLFGR